MYKIDLQKFFKIYQFFIYNYKIVSVYLIINETKYFLNK